MSFTIEQANTRARKLTEAGRQRAIFELSQALDLSGDVSDDLTKALTIGFNAGMDTKADIVQPEIYEGDMARAERTRLMERLAILPPSARALAVNAVFRVVLEIRARLIKAGSFATITLPKDEAVALADVAEIALGLHTEPLLNDLTA